MYSVHFYIWSDPVVRAWGWANQLVTQLFAASTCELVVPYDKLFEEAKRTGGDLDGLLDYYEDNLLVVDVGKNDYDLAKSIVSDLIGRASRRDAELILMVVDNELALSKYMDLENTTIITKTGLVNLQEAYNYMHYYGLQ